ncbi:DUF6301 family protein [Nocardia sp. NBC_01503]|uniref:DUF6301 family protein n=1 Tax=Nocardia sp. NBC_01503 TaxID=2975997 RepID=UPI002E7C3392|nr:DUF6301 family protein [Nocardia sp. NBC_01503]WTL35634.1 DUF6301 family protein [Nocardia sp. NBC_01503]
MQADLDHAQDVIRIAARLDWTWSVDDLDRFCAATGWTVATRFESGGSLTTDLSAATPGARFLISDGRINYVSFTVVETDDGELVLDSFADLGGRMVATLGQPTWRKPGGRPKMRWDLPKVVVFLSTLESEVFVRLVRPEYQREEDYIDEVVIPWIDANPEEHQ